MKKNKWVFFASMVLCSSLVAVGCAKQNDTAAGTKNDSGVVKEQEAEQSEADATENTEEAETTTEENTDTDENLTATEEIIPLRDCVPEVIGGRIGCEVTGAEADDPKVWEIITTHFDSVTLGNELKPDALVGYSVTTVPGIVEDELDGEVIEVPKLDYSRAEKILDQIYDWNEANPDRFIKVRGHVLVWHSQTPEWFFHENYDKNEPYVNKDTMNKRLRWYIKTVLTHFTGPDSKYKDMFYGWDVVNEAVSDQGGKLRTDSENSEPLSADRHGSNSSWYHIYESDEFIINAFKFANEFAPENLELYYNDYNECNVAKRSGIIKLLEAIKANEGPAGEGTRITAMGMQGHYGSEDPDFNAIEYSAKAYAEIVGQVQITEMDVSASSAYKGNEDEKADEYEKQRKRYNLIYYGIKAANEDPGCDVTGITFWGTVDQYSWLQSQSNVGGGNTTGLPQCPLLFDENYLPKPCFYVFSTKE